MSKQQSSKKYRSRDTGPARDNRLKAYDRGSYDQSMIAMYDVVGSYFVDLFYNSHYRFARDKVEARAAPNTTDAYRNILTMYARGLRSDKKLYEKAMKSLLSYYNRVMSSAAGTLVAFEDRFVAAFIPPEYYRDFTSKNKDSTCYEIITSAVADFVSMCLDQETLRKNMDDHKNTTNVIELQEYMVNIFINLRESYYTKFATAAAKTQSSHTVDKEVYDKLARDFLRERRRHRMEQAKLDAIISSLTDQIAALESKLAKQSSSRKPAPVQPTAQPTVSLVPSNSIADSFADDNAPSETKHTAAPGILTHASESSAESSGSSEDMSIYNWNKEKIRRSGTYTEMEAAVLDDNVSGDHGYNDNNGYDSDPGFG